MQINDNVLIEIVKFIQLLISYYQLWIDELIEMIKFAYVNRNIISYKHRC